MANRKNGCLKIFSGVLVLLLGAAQLNAAKIARMRYVMGTLLQIEVVAEKEPEATKAIESAFAEVERLDGLLSNHKEDSEISRINREGYPNGIMTTAEVANFLLAAKQLSELTGGSFDITIEPLTRLWQVREDKLERSPSPQEIETERVKVNYKNLEISTTTKMVRFLVEGMGIDTGGIGKGYALDKALEKIREFPVVSATLNFSGQILFWSTKPQKRKVAVKNPLQPENDWKTFSLTKDFPQLSLSTSGNYEKKRGHIFNPKTGALSENEIRSVTVVSPLATVADALSTGIFAMGLKQGKEFSDRLPFTGVLLLCEDEKNRLIEIRSEGWELWLKSSAISKEMFVGMRDDFLRPAAESFAGLTLMVSYFAAVVLSHGEGTSVGVGKK